jgi:hypothetical protein
MKNCSEDEINFLLNISQNISSGNLRKISDKQEKIFNNNESNNLILAIINLVIKLYNITQVLPENKHIDTSLYIIFKDDMENMDLGDEEFEYIEEDENDFDENDDGEVEIDYGDDPENVDVYVNDMTTKIDDDFDTFLKNDIEKNQEIFGQKYKDDLVALETETFDEKDKGILSVIKIFKNKDVDISKTFAYTLIKTVEQYTKYVDEPLYINRINFFQSNFSL